MGARPGLDRPFWATPQACSQGGATQGGLGRGANEGAAVGCRARTVEKAFLGACWNGWQWPGSWQSGRRLQRKLCWVSSVVASRFGSRTGALVTSSRAAGSSHGHGQPVFSKRVQSDIFSTRCDQTSSEGADQSRRRSHENVAARTLEGASSRCSVPRARCLTAFLNQPRSPRTAKRSMDRS